MYDILDESTSHVGVTDEAYDLLLLWVDHAGTGSKDVHEAWDRIALYGTRVGEMNYFPARHLTRWIEVMSLRDADRAAPFVEAISSVDRPVLTGAQIKEIRLRRLRGDDDQAS